MLPDGAEKRWAGEKCDGDRLRFLSGVWPPRSGPPDGEERRDVELDSGREVREGDNCLALE